MGRLDDRVAVITGGGRGIGRSIALEMAREGATIVVSSRTADELNAVVAEAEGLGARGLAVVADTMDRDNSREPVRAAPGPPRRISSTACSSPKSWGRWPSCWPRPSPTGPPAR